MVTLYFTALAGFVFVVIAGAGLYFWQKPKPSDHEYILPPNPDAQPLFADSASAIEEENSSDLDEEARRASLIARARQGDRAVLIESYRNPDLSLYDCLLTELVKGSDSPAKLTALMSYVTVNELRVNSQLAEAVVRLWKQSPDRNTTAKALHFAALCDNAELFQSTIESVLQLWRSSQLEISPAELRTLFDGEFWLLSSATRSSGAGFILKGTLAKARRELEADGATK